MRIAVTVPAPAAVDPGQAGNVQGDSMVATAWVKYLNRLSGVEAGLYSGLARGLGAATGNFDFVIHFTPFFEPWSGSINILYLQNAFPPESWPGGTVGQFQQHKHKYQRYAFISHKLRDACGVDGVVIPFACDTELFYPRPPDPDLENLVVFVGNNIRGGDTNQKYLMPATAHGLRIYGNPWEGPLSKYCHGKITQEQEAVLYSSAICLDCRIPEHARYGCVNFRVFNIIGCGGFCITDSAFDVAALFGHPWDLLHTEGICQTEGGDHLRVLLKHFLEDEAGIGQRRYLRTSKSDTFFASRETLYACHTFADRMRDLVEWLSKG